MSVEKKDVSPYKIKLSNWFVFRVLVWFLGFILLMSLPVWIDEGHKLHIILIGENNRILFLIVCIYLPFCGLIEYFFQNSSIKSEQPKESE